jgi:hypothetical protein
MGHVNISRSTCTGLKPPNVPAVLTVNAYNRKAEVLHIPSLEHVALLSSDRT